MGTQLVGPFVKEDCIETTLIPPGFESIVPITLNNAEDHQVSKSSLVNAVESQPFKLGTPVELNHGSKIMKRIRSHSGVNFTQGDCISGDEYESNQITVSGNQLPKGIARGCEACRSCQTVIAKWHPEDTRRPDLEEAPVFYPSDQEFEDTLTYISSIRAKAEEYGICRIVPPPSWKPPCPLKEKDVWEGSKFVTRVQQIDKLQMRSSLKKILHVNYNKKRKRRRGIKTEVDNNEETDSSSEIGDCETETFGFEPGPDFTLDAFQKYADYFMKHYFRRKPNDVDLICNNEIPDHWEPSLEEIEGEYWRIVEKPTDEIEVLYGADIETGAFGSGFPKKAQQVCSTSDTSYIYSGWNLNNFPRLPGSVLTYESSDISGVLVPWLYIGMCFSSFCWHVEDHHLYSLNYMHWGAPKMWYGVPASGAVKLEAAMRKHLPDLFEEQPDLLHKLITQISPSILKAEGVPVYRCAQNPGEFVLTFPRAYHAGFNCGFNCAEAVNVAPVDWLPHGQNAIELYQEQCRKTSISHDKLLFGAAREAVKANWECNLLRKLTPNNLRWKDVCGKDGLLSKALKARVEMERKHREFLYKSSQSLKMESSFDADSERECSVCFFDLHISAAGCHHCSPDKYACLKHAKQLCSCSWGAKFYLFRYDIGELNILVEALEGKLSAVYRWARLDLGLSLSSYVTKDSKQVPGNQVKLSCHSQGLAQKESNTAPVSDSLKEQKLVYGSNPSSTNQVCSSNSSKNYSPVVVLALENAKASACLSSQKMKSPNDSSPSKNENSLGKMPDNEIVDVCKSERGPSSLPGKRDMILIDEDDDDMNNEVHVEKDTSKNRSGNALENACPETVVKMDSPSENLPNSTAAAGPPISKPMKDTCNSEAVKFEGHAKAERNLRVDSPENSSLKTLADSTNGSVKKNGSLHIDSANIDEYEKSQQMNEEKPCNRGFDEVSEVDADSRTVHYNQAVSCSSPGPQNVLDRYYRQKGPRIAKVIRRINCNVEPLDVGSVHPGKLWCDSRAIYTKGFRSRVKYIDVLNPTKTCYYISEILDVGRDGPLFMVFVEHNPSEVFVHVSAARCWDMVRERVNQEIAKQHKLGKANLPPLQPPGSLDGMEMFGFSSPEIIQAIQAMDQKRTCYEYWKSRPLMQIPQQSQSIPRVYNALAKSEPHSDQGADEKYTGTEKVLNGLFKKASPDELQTLYSLLHKNPCDDLNFIVQLLDREIDQKPR